MFNGCLNTKSYILIQCLNIQKSDWEQESKRNGLLSVSGLRLLKLNYKNIEDSQIRLSRTARDRPFLFVITGVRFNRVKLCTKVTNLIDFKQPVSYNQGSL
jgi:hypothetical protein